MERVKLQLKRIALAILLAGTVFGCATPAPEVRTVFIERPRADIKRPELPVLSMREDASAVDVFRAYEESLLLCVGYARQLEEAR